MSKFDPAGGDQPRSRPPLAGKTILLTRARTQSAEITAQLEGLGASVIHFPTIEFVAPTSWASLEASIAKIEEYDWLVFTSPNGVRFFFDRLAALTTEPVADVLAANLICAIGPATNRAVESAGAVSNVIASDSRAEGALNAIIDHVGGEQNIKGLRFLIPRARVSREVLPRELRRLGADVDAVETYQTVKPDVQPEALTQIFREHSIDAITFTSSSTVSHFAELAGVADLSDLLAGTLVACIGPTTAETAAAHGLTKVIQPETYNAPQLVEAIVKSIGAK